MTPMMFAYTTLLFAVVGAELPCLERAFYSLLPGPAIIARAMGAGPLSWAQAVLGFTARHREWLQANEARAHLETAARDVFARYDILLAPVAPVTAFPHHHTPVPVRKLKCSDGRALSYLEMLNGSRYDRLQSAGDDGSGWVDRRRAARGRSNHRTSRPRFAHLVGRRGHRSEIRWFSRST